MSNRFPRRTLLGLLGASLLIVSAAPGGAQQLTAFTELEAQYNKVSLQFNKLAGGQQQPAAGDKETLDVAAKWFVYRFTSNVVPSKPQVVVTYRQDFKNLVDRVESPINVKGNREFVNQFNPALVARFKELFDRDFNENKMAIVNAAPLLVEAARMKHESLGGYLADLAQAEKKHDVVKLQAVRGLREYFPAHVVAEEDDLSTLTKRQQSLRAQNTKHIGALVSFIERKWPVESMTKPELDAVNYIRREAIESLAMAAVPAVRAVKNAAPEAPVAPSLLRVLAKAPAIQPEPSLAERVEAAIGLCQIKYNVKGFRVPEYDPEPSFYYTGKMLQDLANAYNTLDLANIKAKRPTLMPWRTNAKRLELALNDAVANAQGTPAAKAAQQLKEQSKSILEAISAGKGMPIQNLPAYGGFVETLRPKGLQGENKTVSVFRTVKGGEVEVE